MNSILIDSGFLSALYNPKDSSHERAVAFIEMDYSIHLIPQVSLSEVTFLLSRAGGIPTVARFLEALALSQPALESVTSVDLLRARQIMLAYPTARLDFVDCCIMALTERLKVTQVATFDRRDFSIFRPTHCAYLELLP